MTQYPRPNGRMSKYPFAEMEIGDVLFTADTRTADAASEYARDNRKKFSRRRILNGFLLERKA